MSITNRKMAAALLASTVLLAPSPALAQSQPAYRSLDSNGVDLTHGDHVLTFTEATIGSGASELALVRVRGGRRDHLNWDSLSFQRTSSGGTVYATIGNGVTWDKFSGTVSSLSPAKANGAMLTGSGGGYAHTAADGTVTEFGDPSLDSVLWLGGPTNFCSDTTPVEQNCILLPVAITDPAGRKVTLQWDLHSTTYDNSSFPPQDQFFYYRLAEVSNSAGYAAAFTFVNDSPEWNSPPPGDWYERSGATLSNAGTAAASVGYANAGTGITDVTDPAGRTWRITSGTGITGLRRPGSAADNVTIAYTSGKVSSATRDGVTTTYAFSDSGSARTATVTNALSQQTVVTSDLNIGRSTSVRDPLNRTTSFAYDSNGRLTRTTAPEGNYVQLALDARGNVTETRSGAKSGSGLADVVTTASFPATCSNAKTCNRPTSTTDARGNVTDYTYDATHGGVLTVTAPAPSSGAVRPQTRYSYTLTNGEYRLTGISQCQTQASCAGTADEVKATASYDANGNVTSSSVGNGSGTLTATRTATYDALGNLLTVDGPLTGTADTTRFRYDSARQPIGTVAPDPDGGSALKHRAVRTTYRPDGQVSKQEFGTVNSQSDADWANFAPLETVDVTFDANSRAATRKLSGGGTAHALTQLSYDALGRPDCSAVRMNTAVYGSLPASACTLGTQGSFGPDRISKTIYDAAGQVTQQQVAVGTADVATERTLTFTGNAMLATLKDAEANLTTYEYDGHDRLSKTRFPVTVKGANSSSTTDYEQLSYDAASNVTARRLRDGQSIDFAYDALNRTTLKNLPGTEPDVSFGYNLLGRLTSASQTGNSLSFSWDALGRNLTQAGPQGTVSSAWDLAGRRTRLTYPGTGLYVDHDFLVTGETTRIRENGATSGTGVLATYAYDNLGRRTSRTFGNGVVQAFSYDPVSRLASLGNDLAATANDLSATFAYNPASQIVSTTRTGDAYAWTGHYNENRNYAANGLNQYTASGAIAPTYDSKGNLTSAGNTTYTYSSENLLTSATGGITLGYDPVMRLAQVASASTTRFAYDGLDRIAEYDGSNALQHRYVHGPAMDEPLVWYEGTGTADRRFLSSDERGSIVALTDSSGALIGINSYDEYGIPGASNVGRFQYTGQAWLPELGMAYYKARIYSPTLGRFLQPDPIGYDGGANLYAYVGNDPINFVDPFGFCRFTLWGNFTQEWNPATGEYDPPRLTSTFVTQDSYCASPGDGGGGKVGGGGGGSAAPKQPQKVQCPAVNPGNKGTMTVNQVGWSRPGWQAINARLSGKISLAEAQANFHRSQLHNGPGDAWRHFRWNFAMAQSMGSRPAAAFANAYEVSNPDPAAEHAMDMYNNAMGRAFGSNPAYAKLSPNEAANLALRSGCLRTLDK